MMELWAAYCAREGLDFKVFSAGCDLLLGEDGALWADRGFPAVRDRSWK